VQGLLGGQQLVFGPMVQLLSLGLEIGVVFFQRRGQGGVDLPPDIGFEIDGQVFAGRKIGGDGSGQRQ
jgi:hypothetical protein